MARHAAAAKGQRLVKGYLYKKRHGAKRGGFADGVDHRFAYDVLRIFSYYETEDEALIMKPRSPCPAASPPSSAPPSTTLMFSFYTEFWKRTTSCTSRAPRSMHMWMNALPIYSGQYGANTDKIMTALREITFGAWVLGSRTTRRSAPYILISWHAQRRAGFQGGRRPPAHARAVEFVERRRDAPACAMTL